MLPRINLLLYYLLQLKPSQYKQGALAHSQILLPLIFLITRLKVIAVSAVLGFSLLSNIGRILQFPQKKKVSRNIPHACHKAFFNISDAEQIFHAQCEIF